jgi:hypothetical protein
MSLHDNLVTFISSNKHKLFLELFNSLSDQEKFKYVNINHSYLLKSALCCNNIDKNLIFLLFKFNNKKNIVYLFDNIIKNNVYYLVEEDLLFKVDKKNKKIFSDKLIDLLQKEHYFTDVLSKYLSFDKDFINKNILKILSKVVSEKSNYENVIFLLSSFLIVKIMKI